MAKVAVTIKAQRLMKVAEAMSNLIQLADNDKPIPFNELPIEDQDGAILIAKNLIALYDALTDRSKK